MKKTLIPFIFITGIVVILTMTPPVLAKISTSSTQPFRCINCPTATPKPTPILQRRQKNFRRQLLLKVPRVVLESSSPATRTYSGR